MSGGIGAATSVRWGLVGTGEISRQIASDFSGVTSAEVVAVCSRTASSAQSFGARCGISGCYDDYPAMLESEIDAIYIGTPHMTHFDYVRHALERGVNVLCEKPLALNAAQVRDLAAIASDSGAFLMEAMWMKFSPLYTALTDLVAAGALGRVRAVRASFGAPFPQDGSSRWQPGGSALLDLGIYPVTLSHMMLGRPSGVSADGLIRSDGVDLSERFTLTYSDGGFAHGASSMVEFLDSTASVAGTDGWVSIEPGFWFATSFTVHGYDVNGPTTQIRRVDREGFGYTPMLREVTDAIGQGLLEHPRHTLADTADIFDTLDDIRRRLSSETLSS